MCSITQFCCGFVAIKFTPHPLFPHGHTDTDTHTHNPLISFDQVSFYTSGQMPVKLYQSKVKLYKSESMPVTQCICMCVGWGCGCACVRACMYTAAQRWPFSGESIVHGKCISCVLIHVRGQRPISGRTYFRHICSLGVNFMQLWFFVSNRFLIYEVEEVFPWKILA